MGSWKIQLKYKIKIMAACPLIPDHKSHKCPCRGQETFWQPIITVCYHYSHNNNTESSQKMSSPNGHRVSEGGIHMPAKKKKKKKAVNEKQLGENEPCAGSGRRMTHDHTRLREVSPNAYGSRKQSLMAELFFLQTSSGEISAWSRQGSEKQSPALSPCD